MLFRRHHFLGSVFLFPGSRAVSLDWQVLNSASELFWFTDLGKKLEVTNTRSNRTVQLMSVQHSSEVDPSLLSSSRFLQEVIIHAYQNSTQLSSTVKKARI